MSTAKPSIIARLNGAKTGPILGPWIAFFTRFNQDGEASGAQLVTEDMDSTGFPIVKVGLKYGNQIASCAPWGRN